MNDRHSHLPVEVLERIDELCLAFEQAFQRNGTNPKIEDYLDRIESIYRSSLLVELIQIDIDYLNRQGVTPIAEGYIEQFPDEKRAINFAFPTTVVPGELTVPKQPELGDRYQIVELIGSGGMGQVYRALDNRLQREVAVKILKEGCADNQELQKRFEREMQSVAALSHPNIVALYDFLEYKNIQFAVMEFVKGETVRECISGGLDFQTTIRVAMKIASALSAAHASNIMHRDIKPENVMVTPERQVKVLDFGLARQEVFSTDQSLTATSLAPGTYPYMSPEQANGTKLTCATDVFSLGTVIFEMLTGSNPFRAKTTPQTLRKVSDANPPSLCEIVKNIPEELGMLVQTMLALDPRRRPIAEQVASVLNRLKTHDPTSIGGSTIALGENHTSNLFATSVPTNLSLRPAQLTGREQEVKDLSARLKDNALVTVLGTGGVGKTSVAVEVARQQLEHYPGGVWLCEFASVQKSVSLNEVLAGVLRKNAGSLTEWDEMIHRLEGSSTLIVLDNCEHVIDAAAELAEKLCQSLPELTILTTSRESLNVPGEFVCRLDGLPHEGPDSDAVALFVARATSVAGYEDEIYRRPLVEKIVTRLEGLPLAIELVASKLSVMSLEELFEALSDEMNTPGSQRRKHDRQRTVAKTVAWSYDLLNADEQKMLLDLSVFSASFTSDAAISVCGLPAHAKAILRRLVDQSVVIRKGTKGKSRYRLLEPVKQFCRSQNDAEPLAAARKRHAWFYADRAKLLGKGIYGFNETEAADALNAEWPDLREAVAWGREHRVIDVAVNPVVALGLTILMHLRTEAYRWIMEAENLFQKEMQEREDALWVIASGHWVMANYAQTTKYLDQSDRIKPTVYSCFIRGFMMFSQERFVEAVEVNEQAEKLGRQGKDELQFRWSSLAISAGARCLITPNDPRVDKTLAAGTELVSRLSWPTGKAWMALNHAHVASRRGDFSGAIKHRREAIELARSCGSQFIEVITRLTVSDASDPSVPPLARLSSATKDLRTLIDSDMVAHYPLGARFIVMALVACGEKYSAAQCSIIVDSLEGAGDTNVFTHEYPDVIGDLIKAIGENEFERIRQECDSLTALDLIGIAEEIQTKISDSRLN